MGGKKGSSSSKRKAGPCGDAVELYNLCAMESAIVMLSPDGKGLPPACFEALSKRVQNPDEFQRQLQEQEATISQLKHRNGDALGTQERREQERKQLDEILAEGLSYDVDIDKLNYNELVAYQNNMRRLQQLLVTHLAARIMSDPNASFSSSSEPHDTGKAGAPPDGGGDFKPSA